MSIINHRLTISSLLSRSSALPETVYLRELGGLLISEGVLPSVIVQDDNRNRVAPFNPSRQLVHGILDNDPGARGVVTTILSFGWDNLHVECHWLFVGTTGSVASSGTPILRQYSDEHSMPTILVNGKLQNSGSSREKMSEVLEAGLSGIKLSQRRSSTRSKRNSVVRAVDTVGSFRHGQSISLKHKEEKGSVGVFLVPINDHNDHNSYATTAGHLVRDSDSNDLASCGGIITPAGLDILVRLQILADRGTEDGDSVRFLLDARHDECGSVLESHVGSNNAGWRADWALIKLDHRRDGKKGNWFVPGEIMDAWISTRKDPTSFTGVEGVISTSNPLSGEMCLKDGATTAVTAGRVGPTEALLFEKKTANDISHDQLPGAAPDDNVVICSRAYIVVPHNAPDNAFGKPGDSGSAVFCADEKRNGWIWCGSLVSILRTGNCSFGVVVPQSEVLASLKEVTGKDWRLS